MRFYLGTHRPNWLETADVPLFVSTRTLRDRRTLPAAGTPWACDSGGFTELSMFGEWRTTPREYIHDLRRYRDEIGHMEWAAQQDAMCEPWILERSRLGGTVAAHQRHTIDNYLTLRTLDDTLPIAPVLQGWDMTDYLRHVDQFYAAGIDLEACPVVGVGSVCRRQHSDSIAAVFAALDGLPVHGFGVKAAGIRKYGHLMRTADSMAWSYGGRRVRPCPIRPVASCANCWHHARTWYDHVITSTADVTDYQPTLWART